MKFGWLAIFLLFISPIFAQTEEFNMYQIRAEKGDVYLNINLSITIADVYSSNNYFLFSEVIDIDEIKANNSIAEYYRNGDTLFIYKEKNINKLEIDYKIPLEYFTVSDAVSLRREAKWYPHRKGELLKPVISISDTDSFIITSEDGISTDEIHLIYLSRHHYNNTIVKHDSVEFRYFQHKNNPQKWTPHFADEFVKSFSFFKTFFQDKSTNNVLNIVEIYDIDFQMCQSLKGMILFGNLFYQIYLLDTNSSWIPHEVIHQWWGNQIFFKQAKGWLFLEESITEYLKLQYIEAVYDKHIYEKQKKVYASAEERITEKIPAMEIDNVYMPSNSAIIYNRIPLVLDDRLREANLQNEFKAIVRKAYNSYKRRSITYEDFEREVDLLEIRTLMLEILNN